MDCSLLDTPSKVVEMINLIVNLKEEKKRKAEKEKQRTNNKLKRNRANGR
jgi:hypothetical protein